MGGGHGLFARGQVPIEQQDQRAVEQAFAAGTAGLEYTIYALLYDDRAGQAGVRLVRFQRRARRVRASNEHCADHTLLVLDTQRRPGNVRILAGLSRWDAEAQTRGYAVLVARIDAL